MQGISVKVRGSRRVKDGVPQEEIPVVEGGHFGHGGLGHRLLPVVHRGPRERCCAGVGALGRRGASNG